MVVRDRYIRCLVQVPVFEGCEAIEGTPWDKACDVQWLEKPGVLGA